jgi:ribosomal protein L21E
MIRSYIGKDRDWDQYLGCLAGAYRSTPHESTTLTPNMMMLGREVRAPIEIEISKITPQQNEGQYAMQLREKLYIAHQVARQHLLSSTIRQKNRYDAKSTIKSFKPGDLVLMLNEKREIGICPKLQPVYIGPIVVINKINDWILEVQVNKEGKKRILHYDKLKPYTGQEVPKWADKVSRKVTRSQDKVVIHRLNVF